VAQDAAWISRYRETVTGYLNVLNQLQALRQQYDALGYSTTLTPEDFAPPNDDIDLPTLQDAVASVEAIVNFMATGHSTNMYKLIL
jgi:hypothetical protein